MTFTTAPLKLIRSSPYHHRARMGDLAGLAASVKEDGIIHSLIVREIPGVPGYELICGERRRRASERAGLTEVPIEIRVGLTEVEVIHLQAVENIEREGLHPMDEASYYGDLVDQGVDIIEIAKKFRRKRKDIERALKLLSLGPAARKAFGADLFDTGAALAIARVADPAKQRDILSAVENGALQPEEIEGYVERTYTNALADAAWTMTDADLVRSAGACSGCPKRSGAQRDLFDESAADRCLDVDCWRSKMAASYDRIANQAHASGDSGIVIFDGDMRGLFMPAGARPPLLKGSGYVDSDATCPHLSGHTWKEAISKSGGEPPSLHLVADPAGRPRLVYREASATRIVRKSDAAQAEVKAREAADPVREGEDKRATAKLRRDTVDALAKLCVDRDADAYEWIAKRLIELLSKRSVAGAAAQFKVDPLQLPGTIESNRRAKQVVLAIVIREVADADGPLPVSLSELAEIAGTTLTEIEAIARGAS
jgi:ParB/RepB/Spo0J family partition protein